LKKEEEEPPLPLMEYERRLDRELTDRTMGKGEEGVLGTEEDGVFGIGRDGTLGMCCCAILLLCVWYGILCTHDKGLQNIAITIWGEIYQGERWSDMDIGVQF
jgi:hypothetical protein